MFQKVVDSGEISGHQKLKRRALDQNLPPILIRQKCVKFNGFFLEVDFRKKVQPTFLEIP